MARHEEEAFKTKIIQNGNTFIVQINKQTTKTKLKRRTDQ